MKLLIFIFMQAVYPLQQGEPAPCPVVAFDTLSAKKLLYYLDSLDFITKKYLLLEQRSNICDTLINKFQQKEVLYKELIQKKDEEIKLLKEKIKVSNKKKWFERLGFLGVLTFILLVIGGK
jgi:hypothetical protein